jgi:DNA-binding CsgD family transcriptional regulator/tetratricopeptide (TPR) repeat protein
MLVGRDPERRLIENLLAEAREGRSAALVIRGEAGIGKTALLEDAASNAAMSTVRATGVVSERDLPFAGLEQLLRTERRLLERLPAPQASALRGAFGLSSERVEDRLLIGLATLSMLAEAAEEGPLLCLVDDLQWVDDASGQAMLFAARRLSAEGVVMLFAVRDDSADPFDAPGVPQLTLPPLSDEVARKVLTSRRGDVLSRSAEQRLLREAAGNPLALLELSAHGETSGLESTFRARVARLPSETRRLLLLAAAGGAEEATTWTELARHGGLPPTAARAAVEAGLIGDVDTAVFRHPLVRSAVYNACSRPERAEAHRLLAAASADPIVRVLHLAAAADEPDEAIAVQLEEAANAATRRGAFASAATAFVRAAELSTDAGARVHRLVAAAQAFLDAGDSDAASRLAESTLAIAGTATDQAALAAVKGSLEVQRGTFGTPYDLFLGAAHRVAHEDPGRALELQASAIWVGIVGGWPERTIAEAAEFAAGVPPAGVPYEDYFRAGLAAMVGADAEARHAARETPPDAEQPGATAKDFRFLVHGMLVRAYLGDLPTARELTMRVMATARTAGSLSMLPIALATLCRVAVIVRDFDEAEEFAQEGLELTRQLGYENQETFFSVILARCFAARGRLDESRELAETGHKRALAHGLGIVAADSLLALAEVELSLGHGAAARELIESVSHPLYAVLSAPDLVEAALLGGDPEPPHELVDYLEAFAKRSQDPQCFGLLARARALLAPSPEEAEPLFLEALRLQTEHAEPFERARTALVYGEFLRRAQRKTDARVQLREALATFEGLNTPVWADRARAELEATGITARKREPSTRDLLTPQELRIARLVASGGSNRDVAAQLFLSPKTVEYHLRKVFQKLGVSSRVELARLPLEAEAPREPIAH